MTHTLEQKAARRARLTALPYPEKVRIVAQMRSAALRIRFAAGSLNSGTTPPHAPPYPAVRKD